MRVIIAGGGTGGLATAIALRKIGIDPLVLERTPAFTAIGAGLGLQVNAMKALTSIGGDAYWRQASARIDFSEQRGLDDGDLIAASSLELQVEKYGEHYYCGHRFDLMTSLLEALPPDCVRVGSRVIGFEESRHEVAVQLEDGDEVRGDLLIGADGLRSQVRTLLFGEQEARFTGVIVWRGLMPRARVPEQYSGKILSWLGRRRHVLVYPLRHAGRPDSVYSLSAFVPADEVQRESWTASGDLDDLRVSLAGACPAIHQLLDCIDEALITGIYFRDPLERWGSDRVALLGDAAHPAPPSAGQGAGMALEDAVMLAACLKRHGPGDERAALREYASRRQPRTARMLESSRVNLVNSQQSDPLQINARNGYYRGLRRLSPLSPPMAEWLLAHDPVAAAEQSPEDFERALVVPPNPMRRPEARRAYDLWRGALTAEHRATGWIGERAGYADFLQTELGATSAPRAEADGGQRGGARDLTCNGVPALGVGEPGGPGQPVVLHLHGGGYVMGGATLAVPLATRLAAAAGGWALVVDYRLAPEHPFPAALDDALGAYRWLTETNPQSPVIVSGECAGGGLAVALALALRDAGERLPAGIHVVSPFCDLTVAEERLSGETEKDPWLNRIALIQLAASYIHDHDPCDPLVSPLFGDLAGLPPLLIHVAKDETLFPQATALSHRARIAGVETDLRAADDSVHSFVLFDFLPEAASALADFKIFADRNADLAMKEL